MLEIKKELKNVRIIFIAVLFLLFIALLLSDNIVARNFRTTLRMAVESHLVKIDQWPELQTFDAMYILGGRQKSQKYKYEVASKIYSQEICRNIIFLSTEGFTGFNSELGRNLTNDEWSFLKLGKLGISSTDVMAFSIKEAIFGTLNEARNVAKLAVDNNYKNLLIIAAPYHSQRVRISFDHYLNGSDVDLVVLSSGEHVYLRYLFFEWLKLQLYKILLFSN